MNVLVIYDVQEKLQLLKNLLGILMMVLKVIDYSIRFSMLHYLLLFFTDFYQLLAAAVRNGAAGLFVLYGMELRPIVVVVVSKCGSLNFYLKWGQL